MEGGSSSAESSSDSDVDLILGGGGENINRVRGWHRGNNCWIFNPIHPMTLREAAAAIDAVPLATDGIEAIIIDAYSQKESDVEYYEQDEIASMNRDVGSSDELHGSEWVVNPGAQPDFDENTTYYISASFLRESDGSGFPVLADSDVSAHDMFLLRADDNSSSDESSSDESSSDESSTSDDYSASQRSTRADGGSRFALLQL